MNGYTLEGALNRQLSKPRINRHHTQDKFHCSDMGKCFRMRILKRMCAESDTFPARTLRLFAAGHTMHDHIQGLIMRDGKEHGYDVETGTELEIPAYDLVGEADLLLLSDDGNMLYEIKTVHSRKLLYKDVDIHYAFQLLTYALCLKKSRGIDVSPRVAMISRDDWLVKEVGYTLNKEWEHDIYQELNALKSYWENRNKELPPETVQESSEAWMCSSCVYIRHCPKAQQWAKKRGGKNVKVASAKKDRQNDLQLPSGRGNISRSLDGSGKVELPSGK